MLKKYLIIFNDRLDNADFERISKVISANYVSMIAGENIILILSSDQSAFQIFDKIDAKTDRSISFLVTFLDKNWYGNLPTEVFDWLDEKFPDSKIARGLTDNSK